jgi:hypothetical protein
MPDMTTPDLIARSEFPRPWVGSMTDNKTRKCPTCEGTGIIDRPAMDDRSMISDCCYECGGTGFVKTNCEDRELYDPDEGWRAFT